MWWVRVQINGQRYFFSAGKGATREQAKSLEAKARQDIIGGKLGTKSYTLEDALVRWLEGEAKRLKHYKKIIQTVKLILPHLQDTPIEKAQDAARRIIEAYHDLNPATVNRRLAIVRRLCNLAWEWGWVKSQIKIQLLAGEKPRHVYLSIPEVIQLAKRAGRAKWHVIFAAFTGLRESEMLGIDFSNATSKAIVLTDTKSGRPRIVPLNKPAMCAFERMDRDMTYPALRKAFEKARGERDIRIHDLRHTAASLMVKNGASLVAVRDILGHSTLAMTSRYSHLAVEELESAVNVMSGTKTRQSAKPRKQKTSESGARERNRTVTPLRGERF